MANKSWQDHLGLGEIIVLHQAMTVETDGDGMALDACPAFLGQDGGREHPYCQGIGQDGSLTVVNDLLLSLKVLFQNWKI